jgi:hypothetical protein
VITAPAQDLAFFSEHATNPSVMLRPQPSDLGHIFECTARRMGIRDLEKFSPPLSVLERWHKDFGSAIGAFCLAAISRLEEFRRGKWDLPPEAAADWVREKWLSVFTHDERENILCLAAFGAQGFELQVTNKSLPHPGKTEKLMRLGLVGRSEHGPFAQYQRFRLREPGWGQLILAAQTEPIDMNSLLLDAAVRDPMTAVVLSSRLRIADRFALNTELWAHLARAPEHIAEQVSQLPLSYFSSFVSAAGSAHQLQLSNQCWHALQRQPEKVAERAWETPLQFVASFMETAKRQGHNVNPFWEAIERQPEKIVERAWETPLQFVASFLEIAKSQGRNVVPLWKAIERWPEKFAERVWESPLDFAASFLETAKSQGRNVVPLWKAIERRPEKVAERAWESPLDSVASFLETAKRQGRDVAPLWEAIERQPEKVSERVWGTPLSSVASFLETANGQGRNVVPFWEAIERHPERVAERAWEEPLNAVASFLETAKEKGRNVMPLWEAIERQPEKIAKRARQTSLTDLSSFFRVAKLHGRTIDATVEILQVDPEWLTRKAKNAATTALAGFCHYAPDDLVKLALADIPVKNIELIRDSEQFLGAILVASRCERFGREDLEIAIIKKLLQRANPRDYPPDKMGFQNVAWLLMRATAIGGAFVPAFLNKVCTNGWLESQFTLSKVRHLADGLCLLALNQPITILRRFINPAISTRLANECYQFTNSAPGQQCETLEFFGCATLCGWRGSPEWFKSISLNRLGKLAVDILPHQVGVSKVDSRQFQFWLGLRAVASTIRVPLRVTPALIEETLQLWRVNLAEADKTGTLIERRVNLDMVRWLEYCSKNGQGLLDPAPWIAIAEE